MIVVAGPRIDPASLPTHAGLEVVPCVHDLCRHLAACDLAGCSLTCLARRCLDRARQRPVG